MLLAETTGAHLLWLLAAAAWLSPSPIVIALKGAHLVDRIIVAIRKILVLAGLLIVLAEDALGPGTGAEKKAKTIAHLQEQLPLVAAALELPPIVLAVFSSDLILGLAIDLIVMAANAAGALPKPALPPANKAEDPTIPY